MSLQFYRVYHKVDKASELRGPTDTAFMLFKEIELIVRKHLFITFERGSSVDSRKLFYLV